MSDRPISVESAGTSRQIGRFSVLGLVGRGGLGEVYAAFDPELGRRVALKVLSVAADPAGSARLRREATTMARLSHPNVARVYDVGSVGDQMFIAMEFIRGQTLRSWLAARPRSWREIHTVFMAAGQGLLAAHREGIVHRDFKPDNVLIDEEGRARVVDFGLASTIGGDVGTAHPTADDDLTDNTQPSDASAGGTPAYMAPEQHIGRSGDARSDQFSFCVTLFEAIHGRRPFRGRTWQTLRPQVLRADAAPSAPSRRIPPHVSRAIVRGLDPDPERRFPAMDALLAELSRDPPRSPVRRILLVALAALALASVLAWRLAADSSAPAPAQPPDACDAGQGPACREHAIRAQLDEAEALAQSHQPQRAIDVAAAAAAAAEHELGPDHPLAREARDRRDTLANLSRY